MSDKINSTVSCPETDPSADWHKRASDLESEDGTGISSVEFKELVSLYDESGIYDEGVCPDPVLEGGNTYYDSEISWPQELSYTEIRELARLEAMRASPTLNSQSIDVKSMQLTGEYESGTKCGLGVDTFHLTEGKRIRVVVKYFPDGCDSSSGSKDLVFAAYENGQYRHLSDGLKEEIFQRLQQDPDFNRRRGHDEDPFSAHMREHHPQDHEGEDQDFLNEFPERNDITFLDYDVAERTRHQPTTSLMKKAWMFADPKTKDSSGLVTKEEYYRAEYRRKMEEAIENFKFNGKISQYLLDQLYTIGGEFGKTPQQIDDDLDAVTREMEILRAKEEWTNTLQQLQDTSSYSPPSIQFIDKLYERLDELKGKHPDLFSDSSVPDKRQICKNKFDGYLQKPNSMMSSASYITDDFINVGIEGGLSENEAKERVANTAIKVTIEELSSTDLGARSFMHTLDGIIAIYQFCGKEAFQDGSLEELSIKVREIKAREEEKVYTKFQPLIDRCDKFLELVSE